MATFTITTANTNIDTLTSKTGGDIYNINGGQLVIDQDSRYGLNQTTSTTLGSIAVSATLGGELLIDARKVRLIPYNTGTGNVPAANTVISQGSASGKLLGVYSALNVAPTTAGSAMPASGYIKIKQWNDVAYAAGVLTGVDATATGADTVGWIELSGDEASTITVPRLGTFTARGEWYIVGTTSGSNATTYQIPSHGLSVYLPGVYVETETASGVYEFYPCMGTTTGSAFVAQDTFRGKVCWISTAGLLRFGHDGTNSNTGYTPPSGRAIRIPNIITSCNTTAARTANALPNATLATRYDFTTTGGGVLDLDRINLSWYPSIAQAYAVTMNYVSVLTGISLIEIATPMILNNVHVGQEAANTQVGMVIGICSAGGTISNCVITRATLASSGHAVTTFTDIDGFAFSNCKFIGFTRNNATTYASLLTRVFNSTFTDCTFARAKVSIQTCNNLSFTDCSYFDVLTGHTGTGTPQAMYEVGAGASDIVFDGISFGGELMVGPYNAILNVGTAFCNNIKLRNIGTEGSPFSCGSPNVTNASWSRATTTATVTSTAHGLLTGDQILVYISDSTAAITVSLKTVTVTGANTFTFTCLNAGNASGVLSYRGAVTGSAITLGNSVVAKDIYMQRVYMNGMRAALITGDNSSKNIYCDDCRGDRVASTFVTAELNMKMRSFGQQHARTAQTSCYGTHWFYTQHSEITPNTSALSWSRSGSTITVTSTGHGLWTSDFIEITASSNTTAVPLGTYSITAVNANSFTFTGVASGDTSGTIDIASVDGRLGLLMNEATEETTGLYTILGGTPKFTSAGSIYMPTIGDAIVFETPEYVKGYSGFAYGAPTIGGGSLANHNLFYSIDKNDGNGYLGSGSSGAYLYGGSIYVRNLSYRRTGAGGSVSSTTVTMTSTTGVQVGDYVSGTNVAPFAKVVSVDSATNITVDKANLGTVSGTLTFSYLRNESDLSPENGFKFKLIVETIATNTAAITSLSFLTRSTTAGRQFQYDLDTVTITLTGLKTGSEIRVYSDNAGDNDVLLAGTESSSTSFAFTVPVNTVLNIMIHHLNYLRADLWQYNSGSTNASIPIQQFIDRNYLNPA